MKQCFHYFETVNKSYNFHCRGVNNPLVIY